MSPEDFTAVQQGALFDRPAAQAPLAEDGTLFAGPAEITPEHAAVRARRSRRTAARKAREIAHALAVGEWSAAGPHAFVRPGQVAPDRPAPDRCIACAEPEAAHRPAWDVTGGTGDYSAMASYARGDKS
jgi:hypothetical protein